MHLYNGTEMSGKYSQPLSISRAQQTVTKAALAHGMLGYFIIGPETRQAERMKERGLMWHGK